MPPDRGESSTEASGLTEQLNARVNSGAPLCAVPELCSRAFSEAITLIRSQRRPGVSQAVYAHELLQLKLSRVDSIKFDEELDVG